MKRHVHAPQRTVTVEDGTVRDLDGNTLGEVEPGPVSPFVNPGPRGWWFRPHGGEWRGWYRLQAEAVFALVADEACPAGGNNRFDTAERTR